MSELVDDTQNFPFAPSASSLTGTKTMITLNGHQKTSFVALLVALPAGSSLLSGGSSFGHVLACAAAMAVAWCLWKRARWAKFLVGMISLISLLFFAIAVLLSGLSGRLTGMLTGELVLIALSQLLVTYMLLVDKDVRRHFDGPRMPAVSRIPRF